jgi:hypothetical protein
MIRKAIVWKSITDPGFSTLEKTVSVNPESHSGLLNELPSAILALSLFNLNPIVLLYNVFQKAQKARTVPAPNAIWGLVKKLDAELWRSDMYLITVGEWSEKPTSENQLQILPSALLKNWTRINPEFHSGLLQELPSAILALSLFNLTILCHDIISSKKALKARIVPAPNAIWGIMNKLDAELWRSDLYLIAVGEWLEKPSSENQLQIAPWALWKNWTGINPEFHIGLSQELPSAIADFYSKSTAYLKVCYTPKKRWRRALYQPQMQFGV